MLKKSTSVILLLITLAFGYGTASAAGETEVSVFNTFHNYSNTEVFVSPDGSKLVVGGGYVDDSSYIWHIQSGVKKEIESLRIADLAYSPDGKQFAVAAITLSGHWPISIYDSQSGELTKKITNLKPSAGAIKSLSFSNDGKLLIVSYYTNIVIVDIQTLTIRGEYTVGGDVVQTSYHPTRQEFASIIQSGDLTLLQVRNTSSGEVLSSIDDAFPGTLQNEVDLKYSPDGRYLISSFAHNDTQGTKVYDAENDYRSVAELDAAGSISFDKDSSLLVIGQTVYRLKDGFDRPYNLKIKDADEVISPFSTTLTADKKYIITKQYEKILVLDAKNIDVQLLSLEITPSVLQVGLNDQVLLELQGIYSNGSRKPLQEDSVKWNVQDFHIAEVKNSILYGVGEGTTKLTATYGDLKTTVDVTVSALYATPERVPDKQIILQVNSPEMLVDGVSVPIDQNPSVTPVLHQGRTFLPISPVIKELGGTVDWLDTERKVSIQLGSNQLELWLDRDQAVVNGQIQKLDVAPTIINGKTMVPLRFVSDHAGIHLKWHGNNQVISLIYQENGDPGVWFATDYVKPISDVLGQYEDGTSSYVTTYPLAWGDPYVINHIFSKNDALEDNIYDLATVFLDVDGTVVVGSTYTLKVGTDGEYESPASFMERTGRVPVTEYDNNLYREQVIDEFTFSNADTGLFVVTTEIDWIEKKDIQVTNEVLFFKGAYVVSMKFSGSIDKATYDREGPSAIPYFTEFLETIVQTLSFTDGAGAAG
ncbi:stalk domain-containing protein [Paenibacillus sp. TRM 82003]|nr:stalk domain-containing protein [Paenibacillus sp. TRM 82003]